MRVEGRENITLALLLNSIRLEVGFRASDSLGIQYDIVERALAL